MGTPCPFTIQNHTQMTILKMMALHCSFWSDSENGALTNLFILSNGVLFICFFFAQTLAGGYSLVVTV